MTTITALPTPPSRSDPANFAARADEFLSALPTFAAEANVLADNANNDAATASVKASEASASAALASNWATKTDGAVSGGEYSAKYHAQLSAGSAASAAATAGAVKWVSGTIYAEGDCTWSPINTQTYRRKTNGGGTTDPSADSANWTRIPDPSPTLIVVTGTTQAASSGFHYVLTNASATTVTLPGSPADGDVVVVTVANGRTDNVIARNGNQIAGVAENMTIDAAHASIWLRYIDSTRQWRFM